MKNGREFVVSQTWLDGTAPDALIKRLLPVLERRPSTLLIDFSNVEVVAAAELPSLLLAIAAALEATTVTVVAPPRVRAILESSAELGSLRIWTSRDDAKPASQ
jgi:anti-anti-sigma regulatory factor